MTLITKRRFGAVAPGQHGYGRLRPESGPAGPTELGEPGLEPRAGQQWPAHQQSLADGLPGQLRIEFPR